MAERNSVIHWLRQYLGAILGTITVAVATITALTVQTVAVGASGSITFDADGDLTIDGDSITKASGAEDLTITVAGTTRDLILDGGDDVTVTTEDDMSFTTTAGSIATNVNGASENWTVGSAAGQVALLGSTQASLDCGGASCVTNVRALGTTSSVWVEAVGGDITLDTSSGGAAVGDDILFAAGDDFTVTGDAWSGTFVGTWAEATTGGGSVSTTTGGVTIAAASAGDDITINTTGGDDLIVTVADDITATVTDDAVFTCDSFDITRTGGLTQILMDASGVTLIAADTGDDISLFANNDDIIATAADDVTITATGGPLLLLGASGQLQIDSTGGIFNAPVSAAILLGGTAYRAPVVVQVNTAAFTPAGTTEEVAATFAVPANSFDANGKTLFVRAWGTAAGNTNFKTVRLRLGASGACLAGTEFGFADFAAAADTAWGAEWRVVRSGADTQIGFIDARANTAAGTYEFQADTAARDDGAIIDACVTVRNFTAASDLTVSGVIWEWH